jgi:predicted lipoprotein with Yx(FWY)xxD motif
MRRFVVPLLVLVVAATVTVSAFGSSLMSAQPVVKLQTSQFGSILATHGHLALYTWKQEKAKQVKCTGACAKTWPPLVIPHGTMAPKHITGVMGTFGEVMRPDGKTQVTYNGHALYTFHGDTRTKILCNGVDGWYVVKVH